MSATELWQLDGVELAEMIRRRDVSCREVVDATLARLDAVNPRINAVVLALHDEARAAATEADKVIAAGRPTGPLHGVPVTTKVNLDQRGCPTDNGIVAFKGVIAERDNPTIANLRKAGAIVIGRTNTPGFSMRWFCDNDLHGLTRNPWNAQVTCGGSSGGAAAATAAGIGPIAQGNDIAGSVRYPAYCCGLVGLRPTPGRIPGFNFTATGLRGISSQLMAVQGPLTRRVRDCRVAFAAMAAGDPHDARWVDVPLNGPPPPKPIKVALVVDPAGRGVTAPVAAAMRQAAAWLQDAGYAVEEISPPRFGDAIDLWAKLAMNDVIAALEPPVAKYGDKGIRVSLGYWREQYPGRDPQDVLVALAERDKLLREWQLFLEDWPLVLTPVSTEPPFEVDLDIRDSASADRTWRAQATQLAVPALGLPAISVPTGLHRGVPLGVQLIAGRYREDLCLDAAAAIEARAGVVTPVTPTS
jgi:amidase